MPNNEEKNYEEYQKEVEAFLDDIVKKTVSNEMDFLHETHSIVINIGKDLCNINDRITNELIQELGNGFSELKGSLSAMKEDQTGLSSMITSLLSEHEQAQEQYLSEQKQYLSEQKQAQEQYLSEQKQVQEQHFSEQKQVQEQYFSEQKQVQEQYFLEQKQAQGQHQAEISKQLELQFEDNIIKSEEIIKKYLDSQIDQLVQIVNQHNEKQASLLASRIDQWVRTINQRSEKQASTDELLFEKVFREINTINSMVLRKSNHTNLILYWLIGLLILISAFLVYSFMY